MLYRTFTIWGIIHRAATKSTAKSRSPAARRWWYNAGLFMTGVNVERTNGRPCVPCSSLTIVQLAASGKASWIVGMVTLNCCFELARCIK